MSGLIRENLPNRRLSYLLLLSAMTYWWVFLIFIFEREREREREQVGEGKIAKGTEDAKLVPPH